MSERCVCTKTYTLELNSVSITEGACQQHIGSDDIEPYTTRIQRNDTTFCVKIHRVTQKNVYTLYSSI
jgi:hypothetical protein